MNPANWTQKIGLTRNPFKDTLDTDLFYRTRQHEEAMLRISIGIADCHALILLTGPSGTGKTLLSQLVVRGLNAGRFLPAFVPVYPGMGKGMLLGRILGETEGSAPSRLTSDRLQQVQEAALALHATGRRLVVIIDEAHFLQAEALHILRTLSNLETEDEKLVTVLLVAEDTLARRLRSPSYASLRGRITFAVHLAPLTRAETEQFIKYRLLKCGGAASLLRADGYDAVHRLSGGIPREINRLLYNGFLEALSCNEQCIDKGIIESAGRKLGINHGQNKQATAFAAQ
jgi:general secretion pathway protein A